MRVQILVPLRNSVGQICPTLSSAKPQPGHNKNNGADLNISGSCMLLAVIHMKHRWTTYDGSRAHQSDPGRMLTLAGAPALAKVSVHPSE